MKIKNFLFSGIVFCSLNLQANSDGGHEAKKEEGGHESAPAAPAATIPAWISLEAKITELSARIKSKEESLAKMLEEKNHLPANSPHVKPLLKQILKEHEELQKLAEDHKKNVNQLNYRFPERNAKANRTYDRIEVKSLEQMEQSLGLDGKLDRNMQKMRTQYGTKKAEDHSAHAVKPAPTVKKQKKAPSIEEEGAIILNK